MTTLGKIVGGGMPLACYGGKLEIMQCVAPLGSVYQAGTLSGNPCAVAAGIETIRQIESIPNFYEELDRKSAMIENAIRKGSERESLWFAYDGIFNDERVKAMMRQGLATRKATADTTVICFKAAFTLHRRNSRQCSFPMLTVTRI